MIIDESLMCRSEFIASVVPYSRCTYHYAYDSR